MVGLELPVLAMEHQYLITEDMPELVGQKETVPLHRFRGRDLHAPGARRHADGHLRARRRALVRARRRRGTSARTCCRTTSTASRPSLEVGFEHFPPIATAGIKKVDQRPVHLRARRQSADRPGQGPARTSGSPAASWRASARAAASAWPCRTGWSTATPASTSGAWTWRATATGPPWPIPMPRCARTIRAASRSASPTRNCRPPGRCAPRRSMTCRRREGAFFGEYCGLETPALVRPEGHRAPGGHHVPAVERLRACRRGMPRGARGRRPSRDLELRQVRGHGAERRQLPVERHGQSPARHGPHDPDPDAEPERQADRRFHDRAPGRGPLLPGRHHGGRNLLHALVRAAHAGRGRRQSCGPARPNMSASRSPARRAGRCCRRWWPRICRPRPSRSCPSARWTSAWYRRWSAACPSRGTSATRSGCTADYQRALLLLLAGGGAGVRPASSWAAARSTRCGWRRASGPGRANTGPIYGPEEAGLGRFVDLKKNDFVGREAVAKAQGNGGAPLRLVTFAVDAERRRRHRRRAGLARRGGGGLGDVRRLRPQRQAIAGAGLCAEGAGLRRGRLRDRDHRRAPPARRGSTAPPSIPTGARMRA